ncbi:MAG: gliding motility-associated protein GldE [Saprospiraceae bacterium]|nr:gliding motility-associated protein GldE [Saprospiraceae bacterium]
MGFSLFSFPAETIFTIGLLIILIISSALISGSEVAFFSLSPNDLHAVEDEDSEPNKLILTLREKPRTLLATILISNNFINIAIVLVSNALLRVIIGEDDLLNIGNWIQSTFGLENLVSSEILASGFNFVIAVIGVTFLLVLFGEVAPKIYANLNNLKFARMMARPLQVLNIIFNPFSKILVNWSNRMESRFNQSRMNLSGTSKKDIDKAIELTVGESQNADEEADILKSIVKFGDVSVKQIMRSRVDVVALEKSVTFVDVMNVAKESGFSRIPVFTEDFDKIDGILYVKDLLGHTDEDGGFNWQALIRDNVLYVPESKKIDDLLREFQLKRTHIAIVVDEYGGSAGIVTLEDIMEEVIGDIKDEFDEEEEVDFIKLSEGNYIFEGKSLLNDVCRIIGESTDFFDQVKGDADSLAGLIIEILGRIPKPEKEIKVGHIALKVVAVSKRRIEKVNVRLN